MIKEEMWKLCRMCVRMHDAGIIKMNAFTGRQSVTVVQVELTLPENRPGKHTEQFDDKARENSPELHAEQVVAL